MRLTVLGLIVTAASLWAHAILMDSNPAPHGVVHGPDVGLRLKFNSRVDASHSRLYLENAGVSRPVRIAPQPSPDTLVGHVTGIIPGQAVLRWQVLAVDGHITRGELPFDVQ
jgi:methionine-rich copper-binding protein CopC